MGLITEKNILKATRGELINPGDRREFTGVSIDSRTIKEGELFFCIKGDKFDGHNFFPEAIKNGARGVVAHQSINVPDGITLIKVEDTLPALQSLAGFVRRSFNLPVVAITGSNGKTTTKEMTAGILAKKFQVLKNKGNYNNQIGLSLTLLNFQPTHEVVVLELGMNHRGEISELSKLADPQIGLITNVGDAHLEFLGSREGVAEAKGELLEYLSNKKKRTAILNADDPYVLEAAGKILREKKLEDIVFFGIQVERAEVRARDIRDKGMAGMEFVLEINGKSFPVQLKLMGRHNIYNALAAATVGWKMGVLPEEIKSALEDFEPLLMHLEKKELRSGVTLINDAYNANPSSVRAAIEMLARIKEKETCLVFGDMLELGATSLEAHKDIGRLIAKSGVKNLMTVGEMARVAALEAMILGMPEERVKICLDREAAVVALKKILTKDHVVLLKGSRRMGLEKIGEKLEE